MKVYSDTEEVAIDEKRKRLHYEQIRIAEEKKEHEEKKKDAEEELQKIEDLVYADTKEQHQEKHKLDGMIDEINVEIEELMRVLERKKKEKDMLNLEKQVHEHKIEQVRQKYRDELNVIDESMSKAINSLA